MNDPIRLLSAVVAVATLVIAAPSAAWLEGAASRERTMELEAHLGNGLEVYRLCADCHLPAGWGHHDGSYPMIAGQHRSVLIKQLTDIRQGNRDNPAMFPFSQQDEVGGEQAIADVTAYIESLPMNPEPGTGPGTELEHGKVLYERDCARCHGIDGEGSDEKFYPRLHGQHYAYLSRQLRLIRNGVRRNANPAMKARLTEFGDPDIEAVADYVSRLKPPQDRLATDPDWINPDFGW